MTGTNILVDQKNVHLKGPLMAGMKWGKSEISSKDQG